MQERARPIAEYTIPDRFHSQAYLDVVDTSSAARLCLIQNTAMQAMRASAERHYPDEACGLLLGKLAGQDWRVDEAREVSNLNMERAADRFILDPEAYQTVDRELRGTGREIIGIYHSHPDCPARPSPTDLANAWDGLVYAIVSTHEGYAVDTQCWVFNVEGKQFQSVAVQDLLPDSN